MNYSCIPTPNILPVLPKMSPLRDFFKGVKLPGQIVRGRKGKKTREVFLVTHGLVWIIRRLLCSDD